MTDADRTVAWLREAMDVAEKVAHAACWDEQSGVWTARPPQARYERYTVVDYLDDGVVAVTPENADDDGVGQHIALNDPASVLRRITADRKLLDDLLAEPHFHNEEDNWYTCAAPVDEAGEPVCINDSRAPGPCDCGRDARVQRRVRLLAEGYGWTEETT